MNFSDKLKYNLIKLLFSGQVLRAINRNNANSIYTEIYLSYFEVIKKVALLMYELGTFNPFEASVVYEFLYTHGLLSKDKVFIREKGVVNNITYSGMSIMYGQGVCINHAYMLTDILRNMGIETYTLSTEMHALKVLEYWPNIDDNNPYGEGFIFDEDEFDSDPTSEKYAKLIGNHAITLFKDKDRLYACDPTNFLFLNLVSTDKLSIVCSEEYMRPMFNLFILFNNVSRQKYNEIISEIDKYDDANLLTVSDVKRYTERALEICRQNSSLLNDFYDDNRTNIDEVASYLK